MTAVFRSVNQALHFAYLIEVMPPTTKCPTQALIEGLMEDAGVKREIQRDGTINLAGLNPLEVRGQCAMIRGAVDHHCVPQERFAILAWFSHNARKAEGVRFLRDWCTPLWTVESPSARMAITWRANLTDDSKAAALCSERMIAGEHQLAKSTVHDQLVKINKACHLLRRRGMARLEDMFASDGLIGDMP